MKFTLLFLFSLSQLIAHEYYSKAEPVFQYTIKSDISGKVIFCDEFKEGKNSDGKLIIKIDDKIDKIDLNTTIIEYNNLKDMILISRKLYKIDKTAYDKIKDSKTYSKNQKDIKLTKMLSSKTNLLNQENTLANIFFKIQTLKDKIKKKNIKISKKYYIYKIYPRAGDFVNFGTPLLDIADLSHAKLTIFVTNEDLKKLKTSHILINDKSIKYKIVKMLKIADTQNISGYKVELVIPAPKFFSQLVKIEIK